MATKGFQDLLIEQLKDVYSAEQQIIEALPKMVKAADSDELREAFQMHLEETRGQVERLDEIFEGLSRKPGAKKCKGMEGLIKEGEEALEEVEKGPARDALLIASAQRIEHYEISAYGTIRTWAEEMGMDDAADLLGETLDEESAADEKLTTIAEGGLLAEGVNQEAASRE